MRNDGDVIIVVNILAITGGIIVGVIAGASFYNWPATITGGALAVVGILNLVSIED